MSDLINTELFWEFIGDLFDNLVFRQAVRQISVYFWVIFGHSGNIKGLRLMGFQTSPGGGVYCAHLQHGYSLWKSPTV